MTYAHVLVLFVLPIVAALVIALYVYDRWKRESLTRQLGELPVIGRVMVTASPGRRLIKKRRYAGGARSDQGNVRPSLAP